MAKLYAASEEPLPSALLPIRDRFAALFQRARDDQTQVVKLTTSTRRL
ncbi:aminoglycoside phosphotransferase family protein [Klebsiella pneumoniae]|nr:aminoglycoside phosphotransferase family protein [Klebsiella pneumoniae]